MCGHVHVVGMTGFMKQLNHCNDIHGAPWINVHDGRAEISGSTHAVFRILHDALQKLVCSGDHSGGAGDAPQECSAVHRQL